MKRRTTGFATLASKDQITHDDVADEFMTLPLNRPTLPPAPSTPRLDGPYHGGPYWVYLLILLRVLLPLIFHSR